MIRLDLVFLCSFVLALSSVIAMSQLKFEDIEDEHVRTIRQNSLRDNQTHGRVIITPSNCFLNEAFKDYCQRILDFEVFPDDVWVVSYPKCGTTWTQEMVWLLVNNFNYTEARAKNIRERFPFIEIEALMKMSIESEDFPSSIEEAKNLPRPRTIKSHLPLELLPTQLWTVKPKVVYVARDPKDVVISFYHHTRMFEGFIGTFDQFVDAFLADRLIYSPYWSHVLSFWKIHDQPHILFNTFEEMKKDLPGVVNKTAKFLGKEINKEELDKLVDHLSFENMKNNPSVNYDDLSAMTKKSTNMTDDNLRFIRKGESGEWKQTMTEEMKGRFDEWNQKNLNGTEFSTYPWSNRK